MKRFMLSLLLLVMSSSIMLSETISEAKIRLAEEGRNISQLTVIELEAITPSPGGVWDNLFNSEFVFKLGTSTFFLNMALITSVIMLTSFILVMFFTPIGFGIFRGGLHSFLGKLGGVLGLSTFSASFASAKRYLTRFGVMKGFGLFMHNEIVHRYKNNITAIAFMGTAFLILSIGLRGVKFMTAHEPTMIVLALIVEMTVLLLLGLTTWYEKTLEASGQEKGVGDIPVTKDELLRDLKEIERKVKS